MYYEAGKIVTCGSKIRRDFVATTTSTALQRLKDAGTIRLGSLQMAEFAYGPTGHNAHYGAVHNPFAVDHVTGGSSSGSGSAVAARLTFRRWGRTPAARSGAGEFLRRDRIEDHGRDGSAGPARCRCRNRWNRRAAGAQVEDCALLLGLMAGSDRGPDRGRRSHAGLPGRNAAADPGSPSAFPRPSMSTISIPKWRGPRSDHRGADRRGARMVRVELPDHRQLNAACQLVLAVEAASFHKRWMIERRRIMVRRS